MARLGHRLGKDKPRKQPTKQQSVVSRQSVDSDTHQSTDQQQQTLQGEARVSAEGMYECEYGGDGQGVYLGLARTIHL
jgi:hypothetical protein